MSESFESIVEALADVQQASKAIIAEHIAVPAGAELMTETSGVAARLGNLSCINKIATEEIDDERTGGHKNDSYVGDTLDLGRDSNDILSLA